MVDDGKRERSGSEEVDAAGDAPAGGGASERGAAGGLPARLRASWANPAHRFVMLFVPYLAIVAVGYPQLVKRFNVVVQVFILLTAKLEYWLFALFSDAVTQSAKVVTFGGFAVKIIDECTGIYEMLIFSAAVLAFPTGWKQRLLGIVLGNPLIYLFNVARIALLIFVGRFYPATFEFMHIYFMQATMIVMITTVWLLWIVKVVRSDEAPAPAAA